MDFISQKWDEILYLLENNYEIANVTYKTFIEKIEPVSIIDDCIYIETPDDTTQDIIERKYKSYIKDAIKKVTKESYDIILLVQGEQIKDRELNKTKGYTRYTFDNFVVGSNNKFAHAAALAVAEMPGVKYNPLFLHGGVGLGKTHLMRAIEHHIMHGNKDCDVLYVTSEAFMNELINSIKRGENEKFRNKYRNIDVLLLDDVQFITDKESTQNELFHTFNTLYESKKQIIFSSDRPPKEIETIEERLKSRFEWGLIADIGAPDYETRVAILRKKAELEKINLPDDVLQYVATNIKSNIRELEGAVNTILAYKDLLLPKNITIEMAENALKDIIAENNSKEVTLSLILEVVANHYGVSISDLKSKKRTKEISFPRHIFMYLSRKLTDKSLTEVGLIVGKRDHSTVINGYDNINRAIKKDQNLNKTISVLIKKITRT